MQVSRETIININSFVEVKYDRCEISDTISWTCLLLADPPHLLYRRRHIVHLPSTHHATAPSKRAQQQTTVNQYELSVNRKTTQTNSS
jgi:hypothetical protein